MPRQDLQNRSQPALDQIIDTSRIVDIQEPTSVPRMAAYDGVYRQSFLFPGFTTDQLLATVGWDAAERDMLNLGACYSPFFLKRCAILANGIDVVPSVVDPYDSRSTIAKEYADFITYVINNIITPTGQPLDFRQDVFEAAMSSWTGFKVGEIGLIPIREGKYKDKWGLQGIYWKPCRQIGFDVDPRTLQIAHVTSYTPGSAVPGSMGYSTGMPYVPRIVPGGYDFTVPVDRCLVAISSPDAALPFGNGSWRSCYRHYYILENLLRQWAIASERWASPVLIAKVSGGINLDQVQQMLNKIRDGCSVALPENIAYDLVNAPPGIFEGFKLTAQYHTEQINQAILHNTLSTGEGTRQGSKALGQVHADTGTTVYSHLAQDMSCLFERQLFDRLLKINFADYNSELCPRLMLVAEDEGDKLEQAKMMSLLIADGVIWRKAKFIRESLGLPPLDPDEEKGLELEAKAEAEAQDKLKDAQAENKVEFSSDYEYDEAVKSVMAQILMLKRNKASQ